MSSDYSLLADSLPQQADAAIDLLEMLGRNYFTQRDTLFMAQPGWRDYGVAGDPVPYTLRGDSLLGTLLVMCFVFFMVFMARSRSFIMRQLKGFVYLRPADREELTETGSEVHFQLFLLLVDCLVLAILAYLFVTQVAGVDFVVGSKLLVVMVLMGAFAVYFMLKALLYLVVNGVFFDGKKSLQFLSSVLFLVAAQGVLLFPLALLQVYFDLSVENAVYYFGFVLLLNKFLTFYKSWFIFFKQNRLYFQNILYFCALEIVPLLAFGGGLRYAVDLLKVSF